MSTIFLWISATNSPVSWRISKLHYDDVIMIINHQPHGCLLNRLFWRKSKKTSKLRVTGLCAGNSPGTGEFPAQMASYAENVSIWWRHHGKHQHICHIQYHLLNNLVLSKYHFSFEFLKYHHQIQFMKPQMLLISCLNFKNQSKRFMNIWLNEIAHDKISSILKTHATILNQDLILPLGRLPSSLQDYFAPCEWLND